MNAAHLHLIVNHLPLFAAMFGGVLMAAGLWRRSESRAALGLAVLTFVTAGWTASLGGRIRHPEIVESLSAGDATVDTEMENDDRESGERKLDDGHR